MKLERGKVKRRQRRHTKGGRRGKKEAKKCVGRISARHGREDNEVRGEEVDSA